VRPARRATNSRSGSFTSAWIVTTTEQLARQSLFSRDRPARFTFYLHEFLLRLPVGGSAVMADQLQQLQRLSRRPYLTLRVVPASLGAHAQPPGRSR
jgi:Domain of unknown function (DUF5753)